MRSRALGRWPVVLGALVGAGLLLLATGRVWAEGTVTGLSGETVVSVTGRDAQPVLPALALLAGAAAAALAIGGRLARRFSAVALALAGVAAVAAAATRAGDAARLAGVLEPAGARVTGVRGIEARQIAVSAWPWLAVAAGVLVAVAGLAALLAGGSWPDRASRYDRAPDAAGGGPAAGADDRDAVADGDDGDERPAQDPADVWDALSRGEDPTAGRRGR